MIDIQSLAELIDAYLEMGSPEMLKYAFFFSLLGGLAVSAVFFFLRAIGLYRLNKRLGNKGALLAFVPGLSGYALGAAADGLKKRKPSNYCIHMLMLGLFRFILNAVSWIYLGGRFIFLYEKLLAGGEIDTVALLTRVFTVDRGDQPLYLATLALSIVDYVVVFVSLLCYLRILQLYRRGGFLVILGTILMPQVIDVYLFAVRNSPIYVNPPVFHMPSDDLSYGPHFDDRDDDRDDDTRGDSHRDDAEDDRFGDGSAYGSGDSPSETDRTDTNENDNDSDSTDGGDGESRL
ncbi:MAG: hypothetical protein IKC26_06280 [Clostridia bacterium]|nr:hypothetical protein [Clostridia bacterium]